MKRRFLPHRLSRLVFTVWLLFLRSITFAQQQAPSGLPGSTAPVAPLPSQGAGATLGTAAGAEHQRFLEFRAFSNLSRITGEARNRSFLTDGNNNAIDLSYLENFALGVRRMEVVSVLRYTDNRRVDPERNSVQRAYLRINSPKGEYNFGDYLVSYTRLTYNQNLKGFHFIRSASWGRGFRLLGNAGTFTDRYGSLFKGWREDVAAKEGRIEAGDLPGKPFTRVVSGLRAEQTVGTDKIIAVNWAYGNDIVRSIPIDPQTGRESLRPVANNVVSLDARMLFARVWTLEGEIAYSQTNQDTRCNPFCPTTAGQTPQIESIRKDYGLRFDNSIRTGPWNINLYYTRLMPSFTAVNARQVADLQDAMARVGVELSSQVSLQGIYRWTNNDLRKQRPDSDPETVFQMPEGRISFHDLPGLGGTLIDIGYRQRSQEQYRKSDRVTRTPFAEVGIPMSSSVLTLSYEHRANVDHLNPSNQTSTNDAAVAFRSIFDLGRWSLTPLVRYQHNREIFDRVTTGNNARTIQATLFADAPKYFRFEALFRQMGATLFRETLDPITSQTVIGPSGFRRPALRVAVTYKFMNDENRFLTLSFERNNNRFAVSGQDFLERVMQATLVWRFRSP
ncbi:MAG: hypothetical protein HYS38_04620 [Acidobacteria bacterium]|nr:hypothetical protein [Acidobacteriota bacterium]